MATLDSLIRLQAETLRAAGCESPALDAELIAAEALGISRQEILKRRILSPGETVPPHAVTEISLLTARRARREPMAYILGRKEFFGREFHVDPSTLIPRPDTELLVEKGLEFARSGDRFPRRFADLGTGSGAIAVTLALELPDWRGLALDISEDAVRIAAGNARRLGAANLEFRHADFSVPLPGVLPGRSLSLLLSNPPYIPEMEYASLPEDVRRYEPRNALVPGPEGTELARRVACEAERALVPGGLLLMEMGWDQAETYAALLSPEIWKSVSVCQDLAGKNRVLSAVRV